MQTKSMMRLEDLKHGFSNFWDAKAQGCWRLREGAVGALTLLRPGERSAMPARSAVDDGFYWPSHGRSLVGGDLFEDDQRLVVRLEISGMDTAERWRRWTARGRARPMHEEPRWIFMRLLDIVSLGMTRVQKRGLASSVEFAA